MNFVTANSVLAQRLHAAGVFDDDPTTLRRIVIDITITAPPKVYVERFADAERLIVALGAGLTVEEGS